MVAVDDDGDFLFGFVFEDRLISLRDGAMMQLDAMMLLLVVAVVVAGAVVAVIIVCCCCCCWCCWFFVAAVVADAASAVFCSVLFLKIFLLLLLALLLNKRGLNLQTWHLIKYIPRLESVLYRDVYVCVLFCSEWRTILTSVEINCDRRSMEQDDTSFIASRCVAMKSKARGLEKKLRTQNKNAS